MPDYRAVAVNESGHVCAPPREFKAENEFEAITRAMQFVEGHAMEVWDQARRIGLIQRRRDEH
jgi:hypothetical protein